MHTHHPAPVHELYKSTSCWCSPRPWRWLRHCLAAMPIATYLNGSWSVMGCERTGREGAGLVSKCNNQPLGPVGDTNTNNLQSGLELGQEGERRRRRNSNTSPLRNGGVNGGCRGTNRCFANKMVMDAVVRVGYGGGVCPVTKATLVVVDHRSRGNSTINLWSRGDTSELTIRSSACVG